MVDRIRAVEARELELPEETKETLQTVGLPRELRLLGWQGPTLFSSEIEDGRVSERNEGYLVGSIRETSGAAEVHAWFCLRRGGGEVVLVDADGSGARFVNSTLAIFIHLLSHLHASWSATGELDASRLDALVRDLTSEIERLDRVALGFGDHYWPLWLEDLSAERDE